jgi:hypothetical protein
MHLMNDSSRGVSAVQLPKQKGAEAYRTAIVSLRYPHNSASGGCTMLPS